MTKKIITKMCDNNALIARLVRRDGKVFRTFRVNREDKTVGRGGENAKLLVRLDYQPGRSKSNSGHVSSRD